MIIKNAKKAKNTSESSRTFLRGRKSIKRSANFALKGKIGQLCFIGYTS
jgi:hypothetical protein